MTVTTKKLELAVELSAVERKSDKPRDLLSATTGACLRLDDFLLLVVNQSVEVLSDFINQVGTQTVGWYQGGLKVAYSG